MKIKLWGVRGSLPSPISNQELYKKIETLLLKASKDDIESKASIAKFLKKQPFFLANTYGGETTCIEVIAEDNETRFIIDAGTGIRRLGDHLIKSEGFGKGGKDINFLITHTHWDHIQGFPFFVPAYIPNNTLRFYSPYENLKARFTRQQNFENFPIALDGMGSTIEFHKMSPDKPINIGNMKIQCFLLSHPGDSYAYRFEENGKKFIFATDVEFTMVELDNIKFYKSFFQGADLLVIDSQYTLEEAFYKFDWGHTSYNMAVNLGITWKVKKLVLTHHDPASNDEKVFNIYQSALEHQKLMKDSAMEIIPAIEGMMFEM